MANVLREGISEELPYGFIEDAVVETFAEIAEAMITGGDTTQIGEGMGAFIGSMGITSDSDAEGIVGAIYTQGSDEDMVGVAIMPDITGEGIMVIAAGTEVSNIPMGEFDYEGTNFVTFLPQGDEDTVLDTDSASCIPVCTSGDKGSFEATVNFATGTGDIESRFENISILIDGDFTVDTNTGTFVGEKVGLDSMILPYNNSTVTIHGNFHGDGATGMTGIYTQNVAEPDFIGAIAGQQATPTVMEIWLEKVAAMHSAN